MTIDGITIIRLQSHVVATSERKLTRFHGRWRRVTLSPPVLLFVNGAYSAIFEVDGLGSWSFVVEIPLGLRLLHIMRRIHPPLLLSILNIDVQNLLVIFDSSLLLTLGHKPIHNLLIWQGFHNIILLGQSSFWSWFVPGDLHRLLSLLTSSNHVFAFSKHAFVDHVEMTRASCHVEH